MTDVVLWAPRPGAKTVVMRLIPWKAVVVLVMVRRWCSSEKGTKIGARVRETMGQLKRHRAQRMVVRGVMLMVEEMVWKHRLLLTDTLVDPNWRVRTPDWMGRTGKMDPRTVTRFVGVKDSETVTKRLVGWVKTTGTVNRRGQLKRQVAVPVVAAGVKPTQKVPCWLHVATPGS
jgi:hypothetical protein